MSDLGPPVTAVQGVPVVTIDGPSASGKGTVARLVAQQLGFGLLDSGALYRIVGWVALQRGLLDARGEVLGELAASLALEFSPTGDIRVDGQRVTDAIRSVEAGEAASRVAALVPVREALMAVQRDLRREPGLVADGRDMGTVVFPDAQLKVYLEASSAERARRRYKQLIQKDLGVSLRALLVAIEERDQRDRSREASPLRPAEDAIWVDSTYLTVDVVVRRILRHARERGIVPAEVS